MNRTETALAIAFADYRRRMKSRNVKSAIEFGRMASRVAWRYIVEQENEAWKREQLRKK